MSSVTIKRSNSGEFDHTENTKKLRLTVDSKVLLELPPEILHHIVQLVPMRQRAMARLVCKRLKDVVDCEMYKDLRRVVHATELYYPKALTSIINQLCSIVEHTDLASFIPGATHSLWAARFPNVPPLVRVKQFIFCTYAVARQNLSKKPFQFVFVATVLSFLSRSELASCIHTEASDVHVEQHFIVSNCWLAILHAVHPAKRSFDFPADGGVLLMFLAHMLLLSLIEQHCSTLVESPSKLYGYGRDVTLAISRSLRVHISVSGTHSSVAALRSISSGQPGVTFCVPDEAGLQHFDCCIRMSCKEAQLRGCPAEYTMYIDDER